MSTVIGDEIAIDYKDFRKLVLEYAELTRVYEDVENDSNVIDSALVRMGTIEDKLPLRVIEAIEIVVLDELSRGLLDGAGSSLLVIDEPEEPEAPRWALAAEPDEDEDG